MAMRSTARVSAPIRRIAASRRSRASPPKRSAAPMKIATGISKVTTKTTTTTYVLVPAWSSSGRPNRSTRQDPRWTSVVTRW